MLHEMYHQLIRDRQVGEYVLFYEDVDHLPVAHVPEKQKPQPTWQDRRKASADAKQALIDKMKAHHAR